MRKNVFFQFSQPVSHLCVCVCVCVCVWCVTCAHGQKRYREGREGGRERGREGGREEGEGREAKTVRPGMCFQPTHTHTSSSLMSSRGSSFTLLRNTFINSSPS